MDEQLEFQTAGEETGVLPAQTLSPHGGEGEPQAVEEAPEEAVNAPDAGLPDALPQSAELTAPSEREPEVPPSLRDVREPCLEQGDREAGEGGPPRDRYAEWRELAEAHPEVVGRELPADIYAAISQSDLPPLRVYESMMLQKQNEQIAALQQEIATLRQNAENSARAPVVAAAGGPDSEPGDSFMKGFVSYFQGTADRDSSH
jgi:hypothetical protein